MATRGRDLIGKVIVSEETGRKFGTVGDLNFVPESGELLSIVMVEPTRHSSDRRKGSYRKSHSFRGNGQEIRHGWRLEFCARIRGTSQHRDGGADKALVRAQSRKG